MPIQSYKRKTTLGDMPTWGEALEAVGIYGLLTAGKEVVDTGVEAGGGALGKALGVGEDIPSRRGPITTKKDNTLLIGGVIAGAAVLLLIGVVAFKKK